MAILKAELREILTKYGIDPQDKSKLWDCHGTLVLYHRAYEVIAARERITFDQPVIIEAHSADKIVALLVTGHMGDRAEWSIGEAAPGNCKNAYVYAIAEKRAKDRVVAKLVGLAEYVYSEDEADEFKDAPRSAVAAAPVLAGERNAPPASQAPATRTSPQAPAASPRSEQAEQRRRETRQNLIRQWFDRDDYGIDPEAMEGGLAAWDGWFLEIGDAVPGLDAFLKLKADNKDYLARWWKGAAEPVRDNFKSRMGGIERKLAERERAAA